MSELKIGIIVVSKVHPNLKKKTELEYVYCNNNLDNREDVPVMVVKEICSNPNFDSKYNSNFGEEIGAVKDAVKYLCSWYDSDLGVFKDKLFYKNQVEELPLRLTTYKIGKLPRIGTKVYLSTNMLESFKRYTHDNFKNFRFKSPLLMIVDYKDISEPIKYNSGKDKPLKICDSILAKCQWFNNKTGKYSEEWLPLSTLCSQNFINEKFFAFIKKEEKSICDTIGNGSALISTMQKVETELGIKENNSFLTQRRMGKLYEWTALQSNDEIILNPQLYNFLRAQKWTSIQNKLFICDKETYGQIDIIAKYKEQEIIVDIIKSSSIDKMVAMKWAENGEINYDKVSTIDILNKYWRRILMHKKMLETNYSKSIASCYLLIEIFNESGNLDLFIVHKN